VVATAARLEQDKSAVELVAWAFVQTIQSAYNWTGDAFITSYAHRVSYREAEMVPWPLPSSQSRSRT
jgi:hypothetical protein